MVRFREWWLSSSLSWSDDRFLRLDDDAVCGRASQQLGDAKRVDACSTQREPRSRTLSIRPIATRSGTASPGNAARAASGSNSLLASKLKAGEVYLSETSNHYGDFIACVTRKETRPTEVTHLSITICHLGNIARRLRAASLSSATDGRPPSDRSSASRCSTCARPLIFRA
jgi:hypothetical protein